MRLRRIRFAATWRHWCLGLLLACVAGAAAAQALPERFDPARDALADYRTALDLAQGAGQARACRRGRGVVRVVPDHGTLPRPANDDLRTLRDRHYVWLRGALVEGAARTTALLARFPRIDGYPHLFVVDADGRLVHSQDTGLLEAGRSYDLGKFRAFLVAYAR